MGKNLKYLVTGGAGFIGSNLCELLLQNGHQVRVLDNLFSGNIDYIPKHDGLEFIKGDVTDLNVCLDATKNVDGIFHLAAMSKVLPSLENPDMIDFCTQQNVLGTLNILKAARNQTHPLKVVYSASSTYYGNNPIPQNENMLPDCQTPYAMTKYIGELYCEQFSRLYNVPTVRLRYFMVYGPREPSQGPYAVVSGIFLNQMKNGQALTVHGDGSQTRDFVHVSDIAKANLLAMESDLYNETINVGTGQMISIKELADLISCNQTFTPPRKIDLKGTKADINTLKEKLKWVPSIDFKTSIIKAVQDIKTS